MDEPTNITQPDVAIIGAGPAGLRAATKLAPRLPGKVIVFERESMAGGIPRHADHPGYGLRDRKRSYSGPSYAKKLVSEALAAGAQIETRTQVTGWHDDNVLEATSPHGRILISPRAFVFATGARERPRTARLIPGDRPAGVYTTGELQNAVHLHHREVGSRAIIVGAELVSWSAAMTLKEAGTKVVALVSKYPRAESYTAFNIGGRLMFSTKVITNSRVVSIEGRPRVTHVVIEDVRTGKRTTVPCDTVVMTGDWIPDNELLRLRGIELDSRSLGPIVDASMQTSIPGIFSVGNVNHPVETADVVALEGEYVAERVLEYLAGKHRSENGLSLKPSGALSWISPSIIRSTDVHPARHRLVGEVDSFIRFPTVTVQQGGTEVTKKKLLWPASPGRVFRIPTSIMKDVNPGMGDVTINVS